MLAETRGVSNNAIIIVSREWDGAPGQERPLGADRKTSEFSQEMPLSLAGVILLKVTGEEKAVQQSYLLNERR